MNLAEIFTGTPVTVKLRNGAVVTADSYGYLTRGTPFLTLRGRNVAVVLGPFTVISK